MTQDKTDYSTKIPLLRHWFSISVYQIHLEVLWKSRLLSLTSAVLGGVW